jgi:uncharacterized protein (TIGR00725 family)
MKYKFVVSGAADTGLCAPDAHKKAELLGREVVRQNGVMVTGATTGMPYWAAKGAKEEGGISVGISPAASMAAHVKSYHLPTDYFDFIMFTGFDYSGRNLLLTKMADAIVIICGRIGTLNEFTIAFEDKKPVGVLTETGGVADEIHQLLEKAKRGYGDVIFDSDPARLVTRLIELIDGERKNLPEVDFETEE